MDPSLSDSPKLQVPSEAPYTLVQIDAAAPVQVTPLALSWHNLSVVDSTPIKKTTSVKQLPTDEPRGPKLLLDNISGEAVPGELLAIVGPSSSALTLLLATISGRSASTMSGTVHVNQQNVGLTTPTMVAEVARENKLYPALTVEEHLRYQAELQLGGNTTREDQAERVADVLAETGLTEVRGSLVGDGSDDDKGITARDRKLLALAIDLISNPSILLLEEPLAGLRAFDIEIVVSRLQSLARNGHTVIMTSTFDQLPSAVFGVVAKLHLLTSVGDDARASTVFHGKPADSITYFQAQGHPCPPLTNPFEFFAHLLSGTDAKAESRIQHLASSWGSAGRRYTADLPPLFAGVDTAVLGSTESVVTRSNSLLLQYGVLFRRNFTHLIHSIPSMRGRIIQALGTALFIGLIFIRLDISQLHTSSFSSACYLVATTQFSSHCLPEVSSTPNEVAVVLRDHRNRLYHALRWYIVKNFVELPLQMIFPMVFLVPVYFLIGFPADFGVFIKFYFFLFLVASSGTAAGYFASCIAKKPKTAMMIGMAMIIPASLFGGAFVNRKTTPVYLLWLQQSSPVKYGYHGLMRAFWEHINTIPCPPGGICRASTGRGVLALNLVHPDKFTSDWHILVIINLSLRLAGALALARRAYAMRK